MKNLWRCFACASLVVLLYACSQVGPRQTPAAPAETAIPARLDFETVVPSPQVIPFPTRYPTPTLAPLGEIKPVPSGYVYLGEMDGAALGFDMSAGGAIGSLLYHGTEFVDDADFGRYIQFSPYDGSGHYLCSPSSCFVDWGWNPLQAGSSDGIPAPVQEYRRWDGGLYIKAPGQEWAASRPGSDVTYETWAWDRGGYFEIHTRMTHLGSDTHAAAGAEAPAAYLGAALPLEYGYTGPAPFHADAIQHYEMVTDQMTNNSNTSIFPSEGWMAFGDAQGVGLIMAIPPQPKMTGDWSMVFIQGAYPHAIGYLAPFARIETTPGMSFDLTYYLIPGPIAEGRAIVYDLIPHTAWTFDLEAAEGWMDINRTARLRPGAMLVELSEANPLQSRPGLDFYGVQSPAVWVEARVPSGKVELCLSFITLEDPAWDSGKTSCLEIDSGGLRTDRFDLSANKKWMNGLVTQLQLTTRAPASLEINAMAVMRKFVGWEFGNPPEADGWYAQSQLDQLVARDGSLVSRSRGDDPYLLSPFFSTAAQFSRIEIRMRTSSSPDAKFFFITEQDPTWGEAKSLRFPVVADGKFHVYKVDMSAIPGWQGQISQLRLDPMETPGDFAIDYVRMIVP